MHEIKTAIAIQAPAQRVWSVLMDFKAYPEWNPFVKEITGLARTGESLSVSIQPPGGKTFKFRPRIIALTPERELRWLGKLIVTGLFDGEHYFQILPISPTSTTLIHGEIFSGLLARLTRGKMEETTKHGFVAFNHAIKARVECEIPGLPRE